MPTLPTEYLTLIAVFVPLFSRRIQGDISLSCRVEQRADSIGMRIEFPAILLPKLTPPIRVVAEPLAQFCARSHVPQPGIESQRILLHPA